MKPENRLEMQYRLTGTTHAPNICILGSIFTTLKANTTKIAILSIFSRNGQYKQLSSQQFSFS